MKRGACALFFGQQPKEFFRHNVINIIDSWIRDIDSHHQEKQP